MEPGTALAHYRLSDLIGKGGMGEVYRARDTKLDRDVAIKILPPEFAADGDRLARFEREAKVLASLHHPNIASIFGFETTPEATFLVMELVEGEDLAEVLRSGALPVDDAVDIARQIAEGLEEAHEKGIIHRDLKPANVKRTPDGKVKVLDFGLARAYAGQAAVEEAVSSAPTMTAAMTQVGTVLGTAAYMSPEQARGKEVDRRADIWAFGVILFEMLTGTQVFVGETASDTLAGILKSDPDWSRLPEGLPYQVERVLRRCLAKDPRQRLRDIGEARVRLEDPDAESGLLSGSFAAVADQQGSVRRFLPWALFAAALAAAVVGWAGGRSADPAPEPNRYRFDLQIPQASLPELAPDGRSFAYVSDFGDERAIYVRTFEESEGRPLKGTEEVDGSIFWSPDGKSIGYFTEETIEIIAAEGGSPRTVCPFPKGWREGSWSSAGVLLVENMINPEAEGWYVCRLADGSVEKIERSLTLESGQSRGWPAFLPDGEHFVFVHQLNGVRQAVLGRLGGSETTVLFPADTRVLVAAHGWYVFARKGQLLVQAFAPETFLPVGETKLLADEVDLFVPNGRLVASVSGQGTVMYATFRGGEKLVWFDRDGRELEPLLDEENTRGYVLSPDGRHLALVINDPRTGTGDLWLHDIERGLANRLTDTSWAEFSPIWSPDGLRLAYSADKSGPPNLFTISANGGEPDEIVPFDGRVSYPSDWVEQNDIILYMRMDSNSGDIWAVGSNGESPTGVIGTEGSEGSAVASPDGRWLAYRSSATGRSEIYLKPFGRDGVAQRVSVDGGFDPHWDGNGRIFYRGPKETLHSVALQPAGDRLKIGVPETVLVFPERDMRGYDLHPDGRILVGFGSGPRDFRNAHVIVGWE